MDRTLPPLTTVFQQIESAELEFQLGLASGFSLFQDILARSPIYQDLLDCLHDEAESVMNYLETAIQENRLTDTALAVYLLAIGQVCPDLLDKLWKLEIDPENLYWTRFSVQYLNRAQAS